MRFVLFVVALVFVSSTGEAIAQNHLEAGAHVAVARSSEFDSTDTGIGARFSWYPRELLGADTEINVYPRNFPGGGSFSRGRVEGLFGVTVGPRLGRARPFARVRPGFLTFRGQPVACILIFPPPLACVLAAGRTMFALDLGGGLELFAGRRTFVRLDAGDRLLKYPVPSFRGGRAAQKSFFSHDVRVVAGAGARF